MVKQTVEIFGGIDILVNNAGTKRDSLSVRMSEESFNGVLHDNLGSAFFCSQAVLAQSMLRRKSGRIINMASVVAQI